jgi:hypothetical protein
MATRKKPETGEVEGLALVDIPAIGAQCGQWLTLPAEQAKSLAEAGEFDPKALKP